MISVLAFSLAACASSSAIVLPENGYAEGSIGDTMRTYFFDFKVDSAYLCTSYEGYIPTPGYDLLAAQVTVKNTFGEDIPMYDWDFFVLFDDITEGTEVYDYPITTYDDIEFPEAARASLLPSEYNLEKGESQTGLLLFEVPAGQSSLTISYAESFDDDSTGDIFYVSFTAQQK